MNLANPLLTLVPFSLIVAIRFGHYRINNSALCYSILTSVID